MINNITRMISLLLLMSVSTFSWAGINPVAIDLVTALPSTSSINDAYVVEYRLTNNFLKALTDLTVEPTGHGGTYTRAPESTCVNVLAAGQSCVWKGVFTPTVVGQNTANLMINYQRNSVPVSQNTDSIANTVKFIAVGGFTNDLLKGHYHSADVDQPLLVYTSSDGQVWQRQTVPQTGITTGAFSTISKTLLGQWIAYGFDDTSAENKNTLTYISSDGQSWSKQDANSEYALQNTIPLSAVNGNSMLMVTGSGFDNTPKIISFTGILSNENTFTWNGAVNGIVHIGGPSWVAVMDNDDGAPNAFSVEKTTDSGLSWTGKALPTGAEGTENKSNLHGVAIHNNQLVAVGQFNLGNDEHGAIIFSSNDGGETWTQHFAGLAGTSFDKVVYSQDHWVAIGTDDEGTFEYTSADGSTWVKDESTLLSGYDITTLTCHANNCIAVGGHLGTDEKIHPAILLSSNGGLAWSEASVLGSDTQEGALAAISETDA